MSNYWGGGVQCLPCLLLWIQIVENSLLANRRNKTETFSFWRREREQNSTWNRWRLETSLPKKKKEYFYFLNLNILLSFCSFWKSTNRKKRKNSTKRAVLWGKIDGLLFEDFMIQIQTQISNWRTYFFLINSNLWVEIFILPPPLGKMVTPLSMRLNQKIWNILLGPEARFAD